MPVIKGKQIQPASTTTSGVLTAAAQTVFGQKTFNSLAANTVPVENLQNTVSTVGAYISNQRPNGSITAPVGSTCYDTTNGVMYFKQSGAGNTGWIAMPARVSSSAGQAFTTTANVAATDLVINQPANTVAAYRAVLFYSVSATDRALQIAISGPGTLGAAVFKEGAGANGTAFESGYVITAYNTRFGPTTTSGVKNRVAYLDFLVTTAGAAGNVQLLGSVDTAPGTATILAGSFLEQTLLS